MTDTEKCIRHLDPEVQTYTEFYQGKNRRNFVVQYICYTRSTAICNETTMQENTGI